MGMTLPKGVCGSCLTRNEPGTAACVGCGAALGRRGAKYGNLKGRAYVAGQEILVFDSRKEARRFADLCAMQRIGVILLLSRQMHFRLVVNGRLVCSYVADFAYIDAETGKFVIEDAKGVRTRAYRIKRKLFEALVGYEIHEV